MKHDFIFALLLSQTLSISKNIGRKFTILCEKRAIIFRTQRPTILRPQHEAEKTVYRSYNAVKKIPYKRNIMAQIGNAAGNGEVPVTENHEALIWLVK